jgi:hypothetical protein
MGVIAFMTALVLLAPSVLLTLVVVVAALSGRPRIMRSLLSYAHHCLRGFTFISGQAKT